MRVVPGANKYSCRANWKLMVENSIDGYHGLPVHSTYFDYLASIGSIHTKRMSPGRCVDLGNGHAVIESEAPFGRPVARWDVLFGEEAKGDIAATRARLVERFGEERAFRMADTIRNLLIFPNLIVNDVAAITVRVMEPIEPGYMEVNAWALAPAEEDAVQLQRRLDSYITFLGPGGFATPDDMEVLEDAQRGFATIDALEYSDISRGMASPEPVQTDELQMRAFWRAWRSHMLGEPMPNRVTSTEAPGAGEAAEDREVA
jgi:p-cumate 2,3-dioxygenase alpha subunit